MDTMESMVGDQDTWIPETCWGTHTWWGTHIHRVEPTYMVTHKGRNRYVHLRSKFCGVNRTQHARNSLNNKCYNMPNNFVLVVLA